MFDDLNAIEQMEIGLICDGFTLYKVVEETITAMRKPTAW